jgi:hypothetical protein
LLRPPMSLFPELSSPEHRRLLLPSCDQAFLGFEGVDATFFL